MSSAWLITLAATVLAVAVAMLALGVGLLFGRRGPCASCGGNGGRSCPCLPEGRPSGQGR